MGPKSSHSSIFLCLLLLLALIRPALGAESVPDPLLWRGEVVLEADFQVPPGRTLRVEAGTRVRALRPQARILVQGTLLVLGTARAPVVFDTAPGWGGIEFQAAPAGSRIEHARFSQARTALSSAETAFALRHSSFKDCDTALKLLRRSAPEVTDCLFEGNGIAIDNEMRSAPLIRNNRFLGQRKVAILASHNSAGLIEGNLFENNQLGISLLRPYADRIRNNRFLGNATAISCNQTQDSPVIVGNHFEGNAKALESYSFSAPAVENNTFLGNATALLNRQLASPQVRHNLFADNDIALSNVRKSGPLVEKNLLKNNQLALFCDFSSYPRVRQNNFLGNRLAVRLGEFQSAELERRSGNQALVQQGAILAGAGQNRPQQAPPLGGPEDAVDVRGNWWGEDTPRLAAVGRDGNAAIFFDRRDQGAQPSRSAGEGYALDLVLFHPWLQAAVADAGPPPAKAAAGPQRSP